MVNSTLLQNVNKNKVAEGLVQTDNQVKNALQNVVSLMNQARNTYNSNDDIEIREAAKEVYNTNLQTLSDEMSKHSPLQ